MLHVVDRPGSRALSADLDEPEDDQDPRTVLLPDAEALAAASARFAAPPQPPQPARPEPAPTAELAPQLPAVATKSVAREWLAQAKTAAGIAMIIAFLVIVAIVGMVGGLGIGIAIANVVG